MISNGTFRFVWSKSEPQPSAGSVGSEHGRTQVLQYVAKCAGNWCYRQVSGCWFPMKWQPTRIPSLRLTNLRDPWFLQPARRELDVLG